MLSDKLKSLLFTVVEIYIEKGDPVGSKLLCNSGKVDYASSTIRKYLHQLEEKELLTQPYHSAGRVPTREGMSKYIESLINEASSTKLSKVEFNTDYARNSLKFLVEKIWDYVDGVAVGFLRNDEYYFLGINKLLKENLEWEYDSTRKLVKCIEEKEIIDYLNTKMIKNNQIYYDLIDIDDDTTVSTMYVKINIKGYDGILSIVGHLRSNYKQNLGVLKKFLAMSEDTIQ